VKRDQARFPRAQLPDGRGLDILSAFAPATREADTRALTALLDHIRSIDSDRNTVLMLQVENEMGMLPVARDYGPEASRMFRDPVPEVLVRRLATPTAPGEQSRLQQLWSEHGAKRAGDWAALFGEGDVASEAFTAWYYAIYVESLVKAGKAVYPLPMYVNAALNRPNRAPGEYPSGGPLPHLFAIWKAGAPSLDLLAPDIYFPNFIELASRYERPDNPLFIPEANNADEAEVPANAFYAFGQLDAIGFGPFSIESIDERSNQASSDRQPPGALAQAYAVLEQLSPAILANQGRGRMAGLRPAVLEDGTVIETPVTETIGDYRFTVTFIDPWTPRADQKIATHGGLIIQTGPEDYLVAGQGITVTFSPATGNGPPLAGLDSVWEGTFDSRGTWIPGRLLNGDQTHQGRHVRLAPGEYQIQRVRLYRYR
jgi:beta-galactosidase GanA